MARGTGRGIRHYLRLTCLAARRMRLNGADAERVGYNHGYTGSAGGHGHSDGYEPEAYYRGFARGYMERLREQRTLEDMD